MPRLPQPGGDNGNWGNILNEYLSQSHNSDGTLKNIGQPNGIAGTDSNGDVVNSQGAKLLSDTMADATYVRLSSSTTASSTGFLRLAGTVPGSVPVVKPDGDGRASVWEMTHNDSTGYLFHLLAGANMGHNAALLGLGVDNDGIGIVIPNKKAGRGIVGDQRATVTETNAYWLHATQQSASAPLVRLEMQANNAADVLQLLAFGTPASGQKLLYVGDPTGEAGRINAGNGQIQWLRNVQVRNQAAGEVPSYVELSTSTSANSSNTRKSWHGASEDTFFGSTGTAGVYYPYRLAHSGSSFAIQTAGNLTAASPSNPLPSEVGAWTTQLSVTNAGVGISGTGVSFFGATRTRKTGWSTATGTATRTSFDTTTVTVEELARRVKALIDDLHSTAGYGLLLP